MKKKQEQKQNYHRCFFYDLDSHRYSPTIPTNNSRSLSNLFQTYACDLPMTELPLFLFQEPVNLFLPLVFHRFYDATTKC